MNDELAIKVLRGLSLDMPSEAHSGHSGTALALAPLGWLLYSRILRYSPAHPQWPDRDRFVLSNGHACALQYGLLHLCGFALSETDLRKFRKQGSLTPGHPESWLTPGVDTSTGPLGQGLAMAVGMAMGERFLAARFGAEVVDHRIYVLCSDGDLMEGVSAEASSFAGHQRLGKLVVCYDDNQVTIDGPCNLSGSDDISMRYRSYGWQVLQVDDGENLAALEEALGLAQADPRPSLIRVRTIIGYPSPGMQGRAEAHSPHFSDAEIRATKLVMGLNPEVRFYLPSELAQERQLLVERGSQLERDWQARLAASSGREEWPRWHRRRLPDGWQAPTFTGEVATRVASGKILASLAQAMPNLLGGSADLAGSTNTLLPGQADQGPDQPAGRNIRYGVREHAMAAISNGLCQHGGLQPFDSTYFAFSDYMKPALRLAALMRLPVIHVWTHDSLALGEDGPTHQPVEQLATLRALPNFTVIRPADANETAQAWELAINAERGPIGLVLSRQALPCLTLRSPGQLWRGAYILEESQGPPRLVLLASGAEVHLALEARLELQERGCATRVVSMPCWELFEEQPLEYQREVLGVGVLRVAIEAGSPMGWHRWVGEGGAVVAVNGFGATASGPELMLEHGFSAAHIVATALGLAQAYRRDAADPIWREEAQAWDSLAGDGLGA